MGQKVNPVGLRLGINRTWDSRWYAKKNAFGRALAEDMYLRKFIYTKLPQAGISKVVIERSSKKVAVFIHTARPGIVIGKRGADIEKLRKELVKMAGCEISLNIVEIRKPEIDAQLVADNLAQQLEKRISFRRAMKRSLQSAMRIGALGVRRARMEWYREGRGPLHTFRANIDYGTAIAKTTYGICGVKVWIFKGEILEHDPMAQEKLAETKKMSSTSNEGKDHVKS